MCIFYTLWKSRDIELFNAYSSHDLAKQAAEKLDKLTYIKVKRVVEEDNE